MTPKKPAHWITIPDQKLHTPVANLGHWDDDASEVVKNKWLWALGFLLLIAITWAVLSPGQFNALIQGNLFDQTGIEEQSVGNPLNPLSLLPPEAGERAEDATDALLNDIKTISESDSTNFQSDPVVKPSTEAVAINIEPLSAKGDDCDTDLECLAQKLNQCQKANGIADVLNASLAVEINSLSGSSSCELMLTYESAPKPNLIGKTATCQINQNGFTALSLKTFLENEELIKAQCTGSAVDQLITLAQKAEADAALDTQNKLIEELQKQVEDLKTSPVETVDNTVRPAATSNTATTEFRRNANTVAQSPEAILRQNQSGQTASTAVQPAYTAQPVAGFQQPTNPYAAQLNSVNRTPDSGPADLLIVAMLMTLMVLGGKKLIFNS